MVGTVAECLAACTGPSPLDCRAASLFEGSRFRGNDGRKCGSGGSYAKVSENGNPCLRVVMQGNRHSTYGLQRTQPIHATLDNEKILETEKDFEETLIPAGC